MYGTIFRFRPLPGQEQALEELHQHWLRERAPRVPGFIAEYTLTSATRPGEHLGLVIFDSRESYLQNANDPEQHRWYEQVRATLAAEPEWNDGEITVAERPSVPL